MGFENQNYHDYRDGFHFCEVDSGNCRTPTLDCRGCVRSTKAEHCTKHGLVYVMDCKECRLTTQQRVERNQPKQPEVTPAEAEVLEERKAAYGDATFGHHNLGLLWTGILQNHYQIVLPEPMPAELVLQMMAASKLNRLAVASRPDDYVDLRNYAKLAKEAHDAGKPKR